MPRPEDLSPNGKPVIDVKEAADLYGVSVPKMYEICRSEGFPKCKSSGQIKIPYRKFIEWILNDAS